MPITENDLRRHGAQAPVNPAIEARLRLWIDRAPAGQGPLGRRHRPRPVRHGSRLRRAAPLIAIPVTAAVIAGAALVGASLRQHDSAPGPAASQAPATGAPSSSASDRTGATPVPIDGGVSWRWRYTLALPQGWLLYDERILETHQLAQIEGPDPAGGPNIMFCAVEVYAPGAFDTAKIGADRVPVAVGPADGYYADVARHGGPDPEPALAWQYAPDAWAVSFCAQGGTQAAELISASAFTWEPRALAVPFSIGYLPPGLSTSSAMIFDPAPPSEKSAAATVSVGDAYGISLWIGPLPADTANLTPLTVNTPNGPRPALSNSKVLIVSYDGFWVRIDVGYQQAGDPGQFVLIAEHLRVPADPTDRATWFAAEQALP